MENKKQKLSKLIMPCSGVLCEKCEECLRYALSQKDLSFFFTGLSCVINNHPRFIPTKQFYMKLRQARKIMKRIFKLRLMYINGKHLPKSNRSIMSREYKALAVVNHYNPLGRTFNRLSNQYTAKICKEAKNKNKF